MSWLRKPGSKTLHIFDSVQREPRRGFNAKCPTTFPLPYPVSYLVQERVQGERICSHCARFARREALHLLALAEGRELSHTTVRRRGGDRG